MCTMENHLQVGLFGDWLQQHKFGKFIEWQPDGEDGDWITVAVQREGTPRLPSAAALNQYVLVQVQGSSGERRGVVAVSRVVRPLAAQW